MIIDCRSIADAFDAELVHAVGRLKDAGITPCMQEILATQVQGTHSYSNTKRLKAERLGVQYGAIHFGHEVHIEEILSKITELNTDQKVHGVLIGMPVYSHIDSEKLIAAIDPLKDVDGLSPVNAYAIFSNNEHLGIAPATAIAAIHILEKLLSLRGKEVAVIGRGRTVGRPLASMLTNRDATVTICHSRTPTVILERIIRQSEIVITATGVPGVIQTDWFSRQQTVVDCGIAFTDGKTVGDVNALEVSERGAAVTPVPKGVGLVTNSMIFGNLLHAINLRRPNGT